MKLTDEQITAAWDAHVVPVFGKNGINPIVFARAIEAEVLRLNGVGGEDVACSGLAQAMGTVIASMQADPDYAWSWHCNVAMAFVDAGGDRYTANQGAARFMRLLAKVEPAHELPASAPQPQQAEPVAVLKEKSNLYWRLHSLSKALEGSGRIDKHEMPDAYATILDAMTLVAPKPQGE